MVAEEEADVVGSSSHVVLYSTLVGAIAAFLVYMYHRVNRLRKIPIVDLNDQSIAVEVSLSFFEIQF